MAELTFDTPEDAKEYSRLKKINASGGFNTAEEAMHYKALKLKGTGGTHSSYWGDVVKNTPKDIGNIVKGAMDTQQTTGDIMSLGLTGLLRGKNPIKTMSEAGSKTLEAVKGIGQVALGGIETMGRSKLSPLPFQAQIPQTPEEEAFRDVVKPITNPIESFREAPVTTVLTDLPFVLKGVSKVRGAPAVGAKGKITPFKEPKPITNPAKGMKMTDLPETGRVIAKDLVKAKVKMNGDFGKIIKAIEDKNPTKTVDITDTITTALQSEDPKVLSLMSKSPRMKALIGEIESGNPARTSLSELQKIKNELTSNVNKSKLYKGEVRSNDLEALEFIDDINASILDNFGEAGMTPAYAAFRNQITQYNMIKDLRSPNAAEQFVMNPQTSTRLQAMANTLSPEVVKAIRSQKFWGNMGIPEKTMLLGGAKVKKLAQMVGGKNYAKQTGVKLEDVLKKINEGK